MTSWKMMKHHLLRHNLSLKYMTQKTKDMAKIQRVSIDNLKYLPASSKVSLEKWYAFQFVKKELVCQKKNILLRHAYYIRLPTVR